MTTPPSPTSGPRWGHWWTSPGVTTKGITTHPTEEVDELAAKFGVMDSGAAQGRPAITTAERMADTILALSGTSNGRLAVEGFKRAGEANRAAAGTPGRGQ